MDHPFPQCEYITLQDYLDHKAMRSTLKTKREKKMLDAEFSKHSIDNTFMDDNLPLSTYFMVFSACCLPRGCTLPVKASQNTCLIA